VSEVELLQWKVAPLRYGQWADTPGDSGAHLGDLFVASFSIVKSESQVLN
jgi:hypothetical protein